MFFVTTLFATLLVALACGALGDSAGTFAQEANARCSPAEKAKRAKALARFHKHMAKRRREYFSRHSSTRLRRTYVSRQQARLKALRRAVAACAGPPIDLVLTMQAPGGDIFVGDDVTYRLEVRNSASVPARDVSLTFKLGTPVFPGELAGTRTTQGRCSPHPLSSTCSLGTIAPRGRIQVPAVARAFEASSIPFFAEVEHLPADPNVRNNAVGARTPVINRTWRHCPPGLESGVAGSPLTEGATSYFRYASALGQIRAVLLFADFPDLPASGSAREIAMSLVPITEQWFAETSYGRGALEITPLLRWHRLPLPAAEYAGVDPTKFLAAVVDAANAVVNFSDFDLVYVVAAGGESSPVRTSGPAFMPSRGIRADGKELRHFVPYGSHDSQAFPPFTLVHETLHLFGLPDLYLFNRPHPDLHALVGRWDPMGEPSRLPHPLGWHKLKLRWLVSSEVRCMPDPGSIEVELTPTATPGGVKMVTAPTSSSIAYVVEARRRLGFDRALCDEGVLVYTVNAAIPTGAGPVRIRTPRDSTQYSPECGALADAALDLGPGEVPTFEDAALVVQVLERTSAGYRVRVTRKP